MNTIRNGMLAALGFAVLALPSAAFAEEFNPSTELRSACTGDIFKLCTSSLFSWDGLIVCLQAKKSQVSPGCRAQYAADSRTAAQKCNSKCNFDPLKWEISSKN
jgi:hypothetical protein